MNRRDVLQAVFLGSVIAETGLAFAASQAGAHPSGPDVPAAKVVIFDARFAAARGFGAAVASTGALGHGISGDVTALWHAILDAGWLHNTGHIVGMTTAGSLLCLEQLVADRFWRTTSREPRGELMVWAMAPRMRVQS
jgi:hypothetical protein